MNVPSSGIDIGAIHLSPSPIQFKWILEGNPIARNKLLSVSDDGAAEQLHLGLHGWPLQLVL